MLLVRLFTVILVLSSALAIRKKASHVFNDDGDVVGETSPLGPLANSFYAKLRLPGFPFEFPPILPGTTDRYLIFPAPDALADHEASRRRCQVYKGDLVKLQSVMEMQILACAIGTSSHVGGWLNSLDDNIGDALEDKRKNGCIILHPEGMISISSQNCEISAGSICRIPKSEYIEGFQI